MKQIQPLHILLAVMVVLLVVVIAVFGVRSITIKGGLPVEPKGTGENGLFDLWFVSAEIADMSVDRNVYGILFATETGKVSLLDRERRLRWEKSFSTQPLQAKLSLYGCSLAVGTDGGTLFYMQTDQSSWWEKDLGEPIYLVEISANGRWVITGSGSPNNERHHLSLYNHRGELQWQFDSGLLKELYLVGEQLGHGRIYYSMQQGDTVITGAINLEGEPLWSIEGYDLIALSHNGNRLAALNGEELVVLNMNGEEDWNTGLEIRVASAVFNPQNGNLLLYGSGEDSGENLYCYSRDGELLWQQRVADGALIAYTTDGRQIIAASWRHYRDDYTQMILYDNSGNEMNRWEVAMRVEELLVSGIRRYIVLAGEDGYIDILDLQAQLGEEEFIAATHLYVPATVGDPLDNSSVTLYFYDDTHGLLPISRVISPIEGHLRSAIEELIRGPARATPSLSRTIPKDAWIETRFNEENGRLYLDLDPELAQLAGSTQSIVAIDSLLLTIGCFPEVKEIYLTVEGEEIEIFGDGLAIDQPLSPYRWAHPVYIPVQVGGRYYLAPQEARDLQVENRDLDGLLQASLRACRNLYFVPGDLRLIDVEQSGSTVTINLNRSLKILFHEHGDDEEKLQAALLVDALMITAVANSEAGRVIILIEGEEFDPPSGYPELNRTFYQTININPE